MAKIGFLNESLIQTISIEFISGLSRCFFEPHRTDWRMFPYTVIVCAFDSEYICEIADEGTYTIHEGEAIIVPGGLQHRMFFDHPGYLNCLHIKYTVLDSIDILSFFEVSRILKSDGDLHLSKMIDELANGMTDSSPSLKSVIRMKGLALSFLNEILEHATEKNNLDQLLIKINTLLPVLDFIRKNLDSNISRRTLADILSLSETRFHYVFKSIMNVSPMKYLQYERLQKAHIMISTTGDPIYEISSAVGYTDYSNFARKFKEHFGETPSSVRENRVKISTSRIS